MDSIESNKQNQTVNIKEEPRNSGKEESLPHDSQYFTAEPIDKKTLELRLEKEKDEEKRKRIQTPTTIGLVLSIISLLTICFADTVVKSIFGTTQTGDSSGRGAYVMTMITWSISALVFGYSLSLIFTGLYYLHANQKSKVYLNTHPYLWALLPVIPIAFIVKLLIEVIMRAILGL